MTQAGGTDVGQAPSRLWYLLAVGVLVAGFAAMTAFMLPRLTSMGERLIQIVAPGEAEVALDKTGNYTIFHESRSVVGGVLYAAETVSGLGVTVASVATGAEVALLTPAQTTSYSFANRSGASIFTFDIATRGLYRVSAAYDDGRSEPKVVLAIGHDFTAWLVTTILISLAFAIAGLIAAMTIAYVVWRRRKAAKLAGSATI